jgi:phosphatidylserine/phosphatidylglycerophosphate/cardiolipin synthase-like enzyme
MKTEKLAALSCALLLGLAASSAATGRNWTGAGNNGPTVATAQTIQLASARTIEVPASGTLEVGFSPNEGSEQLVVKLIDSARSELLVLCYSFTSRPVVEALIRARHRGVVVRVVADEKENITEDRKGYARAALGALVNAGADVRVISVYAISHDKTIVADSKSLEVGSFNYSAAAAHKNSENVLVNWDNQALALVYKKHFERNYAQARAFNERY